MDIFCGGGHHSSSLPGVTSGIEVYFGVPARLNLSEFRRKAIASENWLVRSEDKQINSHSLVIRSHLFLLGSPRALSRALSMLPDNLYPCSSQPHKVSCLYIHTDIINNFPVNSNDTQHAFLGANERLLFRRGRGCESPRQIPEGLIKDGALNEYRILRRGKGGLCVSCICVVG